MKPLALFSLLFVAQITLAQGSSTKGQSAKSLTGALQARLIDHDGKLLSERRVRIRIGFDDTGRSETSRGDGNLVVSGLPTGKQTLLFDIAGMSTLRRDVAIPNDGSLRFLET